eukprot:Seg3650.1 transcript_id=Seg3650.1/GoldUCD/mRNA.D3Y31 product="hypothetical protein" protein_id=Seg3650.1/GoldUCD/D3Y31
MDAILRYVVVFTIIYFASRCNGNSLPEDFMTDNDEQLARLKRENFIDSILKHLPFFGTSSKKSESNDEAIPSEPTGKKDIPSAEKQNTETRSETAPLMSVFPSPSTFNSIEMSSFKISLSMNESKLTSNVHDETPNNTMFIHTAELTSSVSLNATTSSMIRNTTSLGPSISTQLHLSSPVMKVAPNQSSSVINATLSSAQFPITSVLSSTIKLSMSSMPAPHSTSTVSDTAQQKMSPSSTIFGKSESLMLSSVLKTQAIVPQKSSIVPDQKVVEPEVTQTETSGTQMPVLPDEKGYGGMEPTAIKNEKSIGFVYINILLPIVSGITGALFITFAIMLFRCCRRRRLKQVRYFGGKPTSDFVQLDRMNLLTDSSDEDDFD